MTVESWARSGAMALTGSADGPPRLVAGTPADAVREAMRDLSALAVSVGLDPSSLPDERLLGERAALMGLRRNGRISAGGASRLLDARDGLVAITLSRDSDVAAIPALLERDAVTDDPWDAVADWVAKQSSNEIAERATLLGLAIGAVDHHVEPNLLDASEGPETPRRLGSARPPRVVDLSALWAGPLCAHLLELVGAEVITIESNRRPDPTREVCPDFYELLHRGREPLTLDFSSADDLRRLRHYLLSADIVIEASRPRALAQLGIDAAAIATRPGCTWISITAYGRASNRIGYGDDVAAAAGLLGAGPVFAGDAIADPLTGCAAAVTALSGWAAGGSGLLEVAMYDVVRATRSATPSSEATRSGDEWFVVDDGRLIPVAEPAARMRAA